MGGGSHVGSEQRISQPHGALGRWKGQCGIQRRGARAGETQSSGPSSGWV